MRNRKFFFRKRGDQISFVKTNSSLMLSNRKMNFSFFLFFFLIEKKNKKLIFFDKSFMGVFYSFFYNSFSGFLGGFFVEMGLRGMGFSCKKKENILIFELGLSHAIFYEIPKMINVFYVKGKLLIFGYHKETVTNICVELQKLRYPNSYSGRGLVYLGETIKLKETRKK